jgi:Zn-dependent protease
MRLQVRWSSAVVIVALLVAGRVVCRSDGAAVLFTALLLASLLAHEAAHAAVASVQGLRITAIGLSLAGAYTIRARSPQRSIELRTAFAGPLANIALWAAFSALPGPVPRMLAGCNLILGISNLVPIPPSDGWRIWKLLVAEHPAA